MKLTYPELAQIFRGLALLLHAGIGLADGVFLLAQEQTGAHSALLEQLGKEMDAGLTLTEAMEEAKTFPEAALGMLRIGQETGRTEQTLSYLADYYEQRHRTARQIKNALGYPSLILVLMLGVIGVLLMEVLPVFDSVYAHLGSGLTGVAGGLLRLGAVLKGMLPGLLAVLVLLAAGFAGFKLCRPFREMLSGWFLKKCGDRGIARRFNNALFARALAMGLGSGMPLEEALELSRQLLAHIPGAAARCGTCADALAAGENLSAALNAGELLPPAQSRLLGLGLQSGSGDQVMEDIARRLDEDAQQALEDLVARVEPAMVLVCSVLVGLILLAVMLPLMNIMSTIG